VYGQDFYLRTEYSALIRIVSFKNLGGQTVPLIQYLQGYNFRSLSRPYTQCRCPFHTSMPRSVWHKVDGWADVKQVRAIVAVAATDKDPAAQNSASGGPGRTAYSGASRDRAAPRMEGHRLPRKNPLGPMGIPGCEEWRTRAPLDDRRRTIKNSPDNCPSEHRERRPDRPTWWSIRRSLRCLNKVRERYCWLQARNDADKWCYQCSQSRS
jgi:hypothetical protein